MANVSTSSFLGKKPDCTLINPESLDYEARYRDALNYAHQAFEPAELRDFACEYLERPDLQRVGVVYFAVIGKMAWIALEGGTLSEHHKAWINNKVEDIEGRSDPVDEDASDVELSARARETLTYVNIYSRLDRMVTAGSADILEIRDFITKQEPKANTLKQLLKHYEENLADATADNMIAWVMPLNMILAEIRSLVHNKKVARQAGKKVDAKTARTVRNVQIKQQDSTYNLISMNPADIVGSKAALVFNTKTKRLGLYVADSSTLSISGTTIKGFDAATSFAKTSRSPTKDLAAVKASNSLSRVQDILGNNISGKKYDLTGRLNSDTVVLKVF